MDLVEYMSRFCEIYLIEFMPSYLDKIIDGCLNGIEIGLLEWRGNEVDWIEIMRVHEDKNNTS